MQRHCDRLVGLCVLVFCAGCAGAVQSGAHSTSSRAGTTAPALTRDLTAEFELAPELSVTLWAESPELFNPTAIDVDARGRVWVTEAVNYRQWDGRNPGLHRDAGDRVMILEDTDGDGACDSSKVFVQDPDLVAPLGIALIGKQVVVSCSPSIFVYTDEDGDDRSDKREVFLTGFGGRDHDHGVHSVVVGPDGRWYFAVGNAGPHLVTDREGFELRSGSIYTGGGAVEADNAAGLVSSDGRVYTGGLMLRVDPRGANLKVLAHNFRNPYEVALDSFGNMYTSDNDDDGNQACRTTWVMEGGNYGFFSADGARSWQADRRPGQSVESAHWHQDDPGVMPAGSITGAGGPTGVAVYEGNLLPQVRGAVLGCDAGRNLLWMHRPHAQGAGIELERSVFLAARPRAGTDDRDARWFRPSDVCTGVDGSLFVSDWWDPGVGGHQAGDREAIGRILRVAPKGHRPRVPRIDVTNVSGAIAALKNPAVHVRALGNAALRDFGERAIPGLLELWNGDDAILRARALWCLARVTHDALPLDIAASDPDERLAVAGIRAARAAGVPPKEIAATYDRKRTAPLAQHPSPQVRRQIANTFCDTGGESRISAVVELARQYDGGDRTMLEAIGAAADYARAEVGRRLGDVHASVDTRALSPVRGGPPLGWSAAYAELMWRLCPKERAADFAARAAASELSASDRRRAVDALAFIGTRDCAFAMLDLAQTGPTDTRELAAWWIEQKDASDWREHQLARKLGPRGRERARRCFASGILSSGSVDIDIDVAGATQLWLVVDDGENGNGHDWADWIAPRLTGPAGEFDLASAKWTRANAAWGDVSVGKNCEGGPLAICGKTFTKGVGTHAKSEIVFALPAGFTRFTATAGIDDGGALQEGAHPELEFEVYTDAPPDRSAQRALEATLARDSASDDEIGAAVEKLCADRDGALALIEMARAGRLTERAKSNAAARIFRHADLAVRALASEHFDRPAANRARLPPIAELARLPGRSDAGYRLFFSPAAGCSTCHTFHKHGGEVGPDLTAIALKFGRIEILDAMLNPSAAIALGYDTWLVETNDGERVSGFLLGVDQNVMIKDTSGRRRLIPEDQVASRQKLKVSTMPDNAALGLAPQDLADIVSFLQANPKERGIQQPRRALFNGKDLSGWTFHLDDASKRIEDVWSVADGVITCRGAPTGYLRTEEDFDSFQLSLEWRFPPGSPPGNSGVLLRMVGPDQVWPKSIEAQLHSGDAGDIWNIGDFAIETDTARTSGRRTRKLAPSSEKPPGEWNRYEIELDGGNLSLTVNDVLQNTATWCDEVPGKICLQSEGAPIEFRNIWVTPIERAQ